MTKVRVKTQVKRTANAVLSSGTKRRKEFRKLPFKAVTIGVRKRSKENYTLNTHFWRRVLDIPAFLMAGDNSDA